MPLISTNTLSQTNTSSDNQPSMTASTTSSRSTNILTSWIWNHGTKIKGSPGQPDRWRCNLCPQTHPTTYSVRTTSNAAEHLKLKHRITFSGEISISSSQRTITSCKPIVDSNTLRKLIVEWIVDRCHAFNEVEAESFRQIIRYLDPTAISKLPKKGDTICAEWSDARATRNFTWDVKFNKTENSLT